MKKTVRIIALAMVAVMLCLCLASCGTTLSGEYSWGDTKLTKTYTSYVFKGNKVTVEAYAGGVKLTDDSFEGTYKIKDGEITFTFENDKGEEKSLTKTFEEVDDETIKICAVTYKKADK